MSEILKSEELAHFNAIGQGGKLIIENAASFRSALCNHFGDPKIADYLAIPTITDNGRKVDWHIPFASSRPDGQYNVIAWQSASAQEKQAALAELENFKLRLERKAKELARINSKDSNLFKDYLTGDNSARGLPAINFPDQDYVFIVDGRPVITFWGFTKDPEFCGLDTLKVPPQGVSSGPANNFNSQAANNNGGYMPPPPPPQQQNEQRGHKCFLPPWLLWLLLALLLIPLILFLLWKLFGLFAGLFGPLFGQPPAPAVDLTPPPAIEAPLAPSAAKEESAPAETPADPSAPGSLDLPLPDVSLPNVNVNGGSLSGGGISVNPGAGAPADAGAGGAGGAGAGGAGADAPADAGASTPADGGMPADGAGAGAPADGGMPADGAGADEPASAPAEAPALGAAPQEEAAGMAPVDPNMPQDQGSQAPAPGAAPNQGLAAAARQEALKAAREAERQAAIEAARAAENQAQGKAPEIVPPTLSGLPSGAKTLSFNQESLAKQGSSVFDGNWKTKSPLMDSTNGRPLQMSYDFKDGQGQVTVTRPDGSKCVAPSSATVVNNSVEVTNSGRAICPDKSTYNLPKIKCSDAGNGSVNCQGQAGSQHFPVTFYQK